MGRVYREDDAAMLAAAHRPRRPDQHAEQIAEDLLRGARRPESPGWIGGGVAAQTPASRGRSLH